VCPITSIREELLEDAVIKVLESLQLSEGELDECRAWIADHRRDEATACEEQKRAATLQIEVLHTRLGRLADLLLDGSIEKTVFEEKQKALVWEEAELKQKLTALESGRDDALRETLRTVELAKSPSLLYKEATPDHKREMLRILLSNLTVSGKNVSVRLQIPFRLLAEREKPSCGGPHRGTCRTLGRILDQLHKLATKISAGVEGART
jgi:hypothetical protein